MHALQQIQQKNRHSSILFRDQTGVYILKPSIYTLQNLPGKSSRNPPHRFVFHHHLFLDCYCCWSRLEWKYYVCSSCPTLIPSNLYYQILFALIMSHRAGFYVERWYHIDWIPRITFSFITWQGMDVKRVQFPVRLCFAVTVHRSQG